MHAAIDEVELDQLPRLGDQIRLNDHMQKSFFDVLGMPGRDLPDCTAPVLIKGTHLERLEGWREWRVLKAYLERAALLPAFLFRNTPIPIKIGPFEHEDYYVGDVRVLMVRDEPVVWGGMPAT